MARDIKNLQGKFAITHASLLDLFPATYHFESMLRIGFKNHKKS
jgi:tRNA/tmRNA/rRNA uracil-C5-methylase (TrmA/RlmC/RlmD family)